MSIISRIRDRRTYAGGDNLALDSTELTERRRDIAANDPPTRYAFELWYRELATRVAEAPPGKRVELGSGGGFLEEFIPGLVKTDVVPLPFTDHVCRAESMPYGDSEVSALVMVNVLHHVTNVEAFFAEATRVLKPGGLVAMIEPYVSPLSRLIYRYVHHEPFDPKVTAWQLAEGGRLSGGNDALPWIIFCRDRERFVSSFPMLSITSVRRHDMFTHMLSGGVTGPSLLSTGTLRAVHGLEASVLRPLAPLCALFFTVCLTRRANVNDIE